MKLSEAILLGSVGSKQGFGMWSIYSDHPNKCALGAAALAVGITGVHTDGESIYKKIKDMWPWVSKRVNRPGPLENMVAGFPMSEVISIIWMLNDRLQWTRPQIAAWVAEQEAIYDAPKQEVKEESCDLVKQCA